MYTLKTRSNKFRLVHSATEKKWLTASHFLFQCTNLRINFSGFINDFLDFFSRTVSYMLFDELERFLGEIKSGNFTVSNSEITTFYSELFSLFVNSFITGKISLYSFYSMSIS